jgi:hypothetical protein
VARGLLELLFFIGLDVRSVALRKAIYKNRALTLSKENERAIR